MPRLNKLNVVWLCGCEFTLLQDNFRAEGASSTADALLSAVGAPLRRVSWLDRVVARLLLAYTSRGGRGAWRLSALWTRLR